MSRAGVRGGVKAHRVAYEAEQLRQSVETLRADPDYRAWLDEGDLYSATRLPVLLEQCLGELTALTGELEALSEEVAARVEPSGADLHTTEG